MAQTAENELPKYDAIITPPELEKFTCQLGLFQAVIRLIDDSESGQLYVDDISAIFQPIYDGIDMVWARAIDHGRAVHAKKASVDQQSPNSNPSRQLQIVSGHLNNALRVVFSMQEAGPLSACEDTATQADIVKCAALHLLEALNHIEHEDDPSAVQASCSEAEKLLKIRGDL